MISRLYQRAYLAGPIFSKGQLTVITNITINLKLLEYEIFSPYEASRSIWRGRAPKDCSEEERRRVLMGNINNLDWANLLIAWVGGTEDGRTDTGVVWEMGYFNALKRFGGSNPAEKRFTLGYIHPTDIRKSMNLMLAGTVDAIAYGPAQLDRAITVLADGNEEEVRWRFSPDDQIHEEVPIK